MQAPSTENLLKAIRVSALTLPSTSGFTSRITFGRVFHSELVHGFGLQLHPADPVSASVGDDLQPTGRRSLQQPTSVLAQEHPLAAVVACLETKLDQQLANCFLSASL